MSTTPKPYRITISTETSQSDCGEEAGWLLEQLARATDTAPRTVITSALYLLKLHALNIRPDR